MCSTRRVFRPREVRTPGSHLYSSRFGFVSHISVGFEIKEISRFSFSSSSSSSSVCQLWNCRRIDFDLRGFLTETSWLQILPPTTKTDRPGGVAAWSLWGQRTCSVCLFLLAVVDLFCLNVRCYEHERIVSELRWEQRTCNWCLFNHAPLPHLTLNAVCIEWIMNVIKIKIKSLSILSIYRFLNIATTTTNK